MLSEMSPELAEDSPLHLPSVQRGSPAVHCSDRHRMQLLIPADIW